MNATLKVRFIHVTLRVCLRIFNAQENIRYPGTGDD